MESDAKNDGPKADAEDARAGREAASGDAGARIGVLEAELKAARQDASRNHERWMLERADLENQKKRAARERAETIRFANESILKDLLPIVDNLERAIEHARGGGDGAPLVEGVSLVLKSLLDVLERHGVRRIETAGARFDPAHHEAMAHIESPQHPPNAVMEEHQAGYRLNDRLLRPALVTVAKAPEDKAPEDKASEAKASEAKASEDKASPRDGNLAKDKTRD